MHIDQDAVQQDDDCRLKCRILLVGLDASYRSALLTYLADESGIHALTASGYNTIAACDAERFDIILVDVEGADVYAPNLIAEIRCSSGLSSDAVVIAIGALIMRELKAQIVRAGVDIVLENVCDPQEIGREILSRAVL